jgi:serine protease Do
MSFWKKLFASVTTLVFITVLAANAQTQQSAQADRKDFAAQGRQNGSSQNTPAQTHGKAGFLQQFNDSLEALTEKVAPAVVQVVVTGYGPADEGAGTIARQHSLGSGVIVDPDGYIITNAHVVEGAQRIRVTLNKPSESPTSVLSAGDKSTFDAKIVGTHAESDLALLKIDAKGLPFLPVDPARAVRQGELVIALGSPEGLENSVTMGVVSSVARQADPDRPMVYIQTDAPINHGNSGGPLVDIDGYLVGINTFIFSTGGGSEGLGFAIPAKAVKFVYDRLRKQGHVDRSEIGATAQAITPTLAEGLGLPIVSGVIIADVAPGGPAEDAGLKIRDIVLTVDGTPIDSLPMLSSSLYLHPTDELMTMVVLRGKERLTLHVPVIQQKHDVDRLLDLADPEKNVIGKFGVLGIDVDSKIAEMLPDLRVKSGVVVVARTAYRASAIAGLMPGDVIHSLNTTAINNMEDLRNAVKPLKFGDAVVLQLERDGKLEYVAFEFE